MSIAIITGSNGLVGSESVRKFADKFDHIIGIDNNLREYYFGEDGSTLSNLMKLKDVYPNYISCDIDVRNYDELKLLFEKYNSDISLIIHAAAQPSHDWAATEPLTDFSVNAVGTINLLELTRNHCPKATFIFLSTNKVYGDNPNHLPLVEHTTRWELAEEHPYAEHGIDENMSIDRTLHSVFGASKTAADIMAQEFGMYFGLNTGIFRSGCITGPAHSGTRLHGFLAYLVKCAKFSRTYTIYGYKGKQVRDNLHSQDLVNMFWHFHKNPKSGQIYNVGGGRYSNCSVLEAIDMIEEQTDKKIITQFSTENRVGDHIWWISDVKKFKKDYPNWFHKYGIKEILSDLIKNQ